MMKTLLFFLLLPLWSISQDSTFANSNLTFTGNRLHDAKYYDLQIMNLDEVRFDIYHSSIQQQIFRAYSSGTQHVFLMRVSDAVDRATLQLICDTSHGDSQIELAGTGNTPIHLDSDAYVRLGNQSGLAPGQLRFYNSGNSNYIAFKAPTSFGVNMTYTLPTNQNNGVLTNTGGTLSWGTSTPTSTTSFISLVASFPNSVLPGGTQYFGNLIKPMTTTSGNSKVYLRQSCTITSAEISSMSQTAGSNETWELYIRVNDLVDYLIATTSVSTSFRVWSNTSLSIPINPGDFFEMKLVNPVWANTPQNTTFGGYVSIQY